MPKSKLSSKGTTGSSNDSIAWLDTRLEAARFAAFALAIWSLKAADDLRTDGAMGSGDSAVELVDAIDGIVPSQEFADD
jgi:hypothetical protein